jgi:ankyrin repeat protein
LAASAGVLDCVLLLVKHGAKLNAKNKEGNTPLSLLTIKGTPLSSLPPRARALHRRRFGFRC